MRKSTSFKRRISICIVLSSLCSLSQAHAQTPIDEKAVMAVVDTSIKEYRVYATCMSLDEFSLSSVKEIWNKSREEALHNLKSGGASVMFLARFTLATEDSKILDADMPLSDAMTYCYKNKKNLVRFYEFGQSNLDQEIYKLQKKSK
jgi:hypothetical protein